MTHQSPDLPIESLDVASQRVVHEYLAGSWSELTAKPWPEVRNFLLDELLQRCPGFSTRDYRIALNKNLAGRAEAARRSLLSRAALLGGLVSAFLIAAVVGCEGQTSSPTRDSNAPLGTKSVPLKPTTENRVEVGGDGFRPASVTLGANRAVVFRRTTDATCATAVTFPSLGLTEQLPLNTDVVVELPAAAGTDVSFQCGVGMFKGKVIAR